MKNPKFDLLYLKNCPVDQGPGSSVDSHEFKRRHRIVFEINKGVNCSSTLSGRIVNVENITIAERQSRPELEKYDN